MPVLTCKKTALREKFSKTCFVRLGELNVRDFSIILKLDCHLEVEGVSESRIFPSHDVADKKGAKKIAWDTLNRLDRHSTTQTTT